MSHIRLILALGLLTSISLPAMATKPASFCSISAGGNKTVRAAQERLCGRGITLLSPAPTGASATLLPALTSPESQEATEEAAAAIEEAMDANGAAWNADEQDIAAQVEAEDLDRAVAIPAVEETQLAEDVPSTDHPNGMETVVEGPEESFDMPAAAPASEAPPMEAAPMEAAAPSGYIAHPVPQIQRPAEKLSQIEGLQLPASLQQDLKSLRQAAARPGNITSEQQKEARKELMQRIKEINYAKRLEFDGQTKLHLQYMQALKNVAGIGDYKDAIKLVEKAEANQNLTLEQIQTLRAYTALLRVDLLEQGKGDCAEHPASEDCSDWSRFRDAAGLSGDEI